MNIKRILAIASVSSYWFAANHIDKKSTRAKVYESGRSLSQKYKKYTFWDNLLEPFIIKQFGLFFGIGHSFIKGMISDNDIKIDHQLHDVIAEVIEE